MTVGAKPVAPPDLYCITDPDLCPHSVVEQVRMMVEGGAKLIQFRHKTAPDATFRLLALQCQTVCRWGGATFIVNDRAVLAGEIRADGLHLGQGDMAPAQARSIMGDEAVIGLSTHNWQQFETALDEPVDYIAIGPVFGTTTKLNPDPTTGLDLVRRTVERLAGDHRPLVLIGGITMANAPEVLAVAPNAFLASIGGVLKAPDIIQQVKAFRRLMKPDR